MQASEVISFEALKEGSEFMSELADEVADAVTREIKADPVFILDLLQNLRVNAGIAGVMSSAEHFRDLKGLPGAAVCAHRFELYDVCLAQALPEGMLLEFGVAGGSSINYWANLVNARPVYGFDSFEGLPEAWHAHPAGEYTQRGILPPVPENVSLIKGWFNQTLEGFVKAKKSRA